ncbi:hypothetical protein [Methylobacillus flagellatus]|uniref:hypothetical protein n=1 Tax=Methylobacillus flagellatus TaxID=405 RepID=UPI000039DFDC|nr:hypothetical protein [Methylobacillus flagellatus]
MKSEKLSPIVKEALIEYMRLGLTPQLGNINDFPKDVESEFAGIQVYFPKFKARVEIRAILGDYPYTVYGAIA